jgi:hypothetical protein
MGHDIFMRVARTFIDTRNQAITPVAFPDAFSAFTQV